MSIFPAAILHSINFIYKFVSDSQLCSKLKRTNLVVPIVLETWDIHTLKTLWNHVLARSIKEAVGDDCVTLLECQLFAADGTHGHFDSRDVAVSNVQLRY